jgi:predicted ATPase/class 3 adenylate cyclase
MRADLPRGTVTFLFTDIEGSTRLLHALGPDAYADALAEHRRVLREAFATHGGVEVDTQGDAFFVAFPTAEGAAAAALHGRDALTPGPISVRIGLHTGTPNVAGEGYVGIDVHRGARVAALAHGGQIVVSPTTAALLGGETLLDLGLHRLKDFDGATRLQQLGTGAFAPLRTPGSVELPTPATRFLGRERELFDAVSLFLGHDPRVLTIVGPGGTGKTRFALELARLLAEEADGGTLFVPLAPLRDHELALPAIGEKLGAQGADPASLAAAAGSRRTHLLVDNAEHLLPALARPLGELVIAAPSVFLLVTSREPLRIQGEVELDLPPLVDEEAETLFLERARAVRPTLERSDAVDEICRRLDGLPLAIELAAARTKLLSPEQLLARLTERLDLLAGTRDAEERHTTLRATIGWSYDLLELAEQTLFARLSVFAAGCTLESAETVCAADLDTLASLLDKSLIRRRTGRLGEERFWMLETIRAFASDQFGTPGEADDTRRRHAERMVEIARSANLTEENDDPIDFDKALAERDDFRAALDWATANDPELGLQLAAPLELFFAVHAPSEGVQRLQDLLGRTAKISARLRANALRSLGSSAHQLAAFEIADAAYEESLRLFTELDDERGMAALWLRLASRAYEQGDLELARRLVEDSERVARDRFRTIEAQTALYRGRFSREGGDLHDAVAHFERSRELAASIDWGWWQAIGLTLLADVKRRLGELSLADRYGRDALTLLLAQESRGWCVNALGTVGQVALARGEVDRAGLLWGAMSAEGERSPSWEIRRDSWAGALLDEDRPEFAAAAARGRELEFWDAVAIALEGPEAHTVP